MLLKVSCQYQSFDLWMIYIPNLPFISEHSSSSSKISQHGDVEKIVVMKKILPSGNKNIFLLYIGGEDKENEAKKDMQIATAKLFEKRTKAAEIVQTDSARIPMPLSRKWQTIIDDTISK